MENYKGGYIGTLFGSESIQEDDVTDQGSLPFIKVSSLSAETFKLSNIDWFVSERRAKFCKAEKNYIVFPKRGAAIFTNKVNVIEVDSVIDPNLMGWKIGKQGITEYFALLLKTRGLDDIADVSTVPQINNKHIAPEKFPLPPLSEQCEIVKFVGMELTKFDEMISVHDKFHRTLILSGFCLLKIAKISLNSSFSQNQLNAESPFEHSLNHSEINSLRVVHASLFLSLFLIMLPFTR